MLVSLRMRDGATVVVRAYETQGGKARAIGCPMAGDSRAAGELARLALAGGRREQTNVVRAELKRREANPLEPVVGAGICVEVLDGLHGPYRLVREAEELRGGNGLRARGVATVRSAGDRVPRLSPQSEPVERDTGGVGKRGQCRDV